MIEKQTEEKPKGLPRRDFLKYAGITAGATALIIAGCKKHKDPVPATVDNGINLGSGDVGVLNYAYALEQLEAAFYTMVVADPNFLTTFNTSEQGILTDIRDHEIVHRDFLKAALGSSALQNLTPVFTSVNFSNKASVLGTAKTFEDLGVSAYNGAGHLLTDGNNLLVAGKIVSVEARHASAIRDMLSAAPLNSADFSGDDVVDATTGLDQAKSPSQVLAAAGPFIKEKLDPSNLPTY